MLPKSLLQRNVLALVKSVLGAAAERGAFTKTLVIFDPFGGTFVSVQERNVMFVQLLLGGDWRKLVSLSSTHYVCYSLFGGSQAFEGWQTENARNRWVRNWRLGHVHKPAHWRVSNASQINKGD